MATIEDTTSKLDTLKLFFAILLVGAGIFGFHYYADQSLLYRVLVLLGIIIVALVVIYQTAVGRLGWAYLQDSRVELKRVVWPTRQQALQMTLMVCFLVVLASIFMWGLDWVIGSLIGWLLGLGG